MNVLFLTETKFASEPHRESSTRNRCFHFAESLQNHGYLADVATLEDFSASSLSRYDVVSVLRPTTSNKLLNLLQRCGKQGIRTVADFDDLVFDPSITKNSKLHARFSRHSLAIQHFDEVTVATEELARLRRIKAPSQPVTVVPNGLSNYWLAMNSTVFSENAAFLENSAQKHTLRQITYLPGTRSHNADFAVAQDAIASYMTANKEAQLNIVGPLHIKDEWLPADRINRGAWTDYMHLPLVLERSWVCIDPLKNNRLNEAKSHVNFIESAAFGTPIICSPTPDLAQHNVDGLILAETEEQWLSAFEKLSDNDYYQHCQKQLQDYARTHCLADNAIKPLISRWDSQPEQIQNEPTADLSKAG